MCPDEGIGPYGLQTQCACDDAWTGPLCDWCCAVPNATACVHVNASDGPLSCNGGAGTCVPKFYGARCNKFCDPVVTCNSSKATCSATGECVCGSDEGWDYDRAACVSCPTAPPGLCPVADEVCCGRSQQCANGPSCICLPQYTGQFCETQCCPSEAHGFCGADASCLCDVDADDVGMFLSNCTVPCPLDANNLVCGGHGLCTLNGSDAVCECEEGWFGPACSCQSATCHGHGRCSLAQQGAPCECYAPWDAATDCSSCLPGFYGTECSVLCFDTTCKRGSACSATGCANCENGFNATTQLHTVNSTLLRGVFRGTQQIDMSCGQNAAQAAILQANGTTLARIACGKRADRALVNFGDILVDAPVNLNLSFVTVSGCDRCYDNFYPDPAMTTDLQPCTTFCDDRLCSFSGECNRSTGLCHCTKPHVKQTQSRLNRLFCSQCDDGWGPPPQNGPTCNVFCNATATNYAECMLSAAMGGETISCDSSKMCADGERCTYNFTAPFTGNVTCPDVKNVVRLCAVPTNNSNVDSVNMPCYGVVQTDIQDCNFCSGNGDCMSGTCNCGQRRPDAPSLRKQNQRIDAYHGLHCQLTCTQPGSTNVCSGHGVCLQPDADKPPYCVCDGGGSVTAQQWAEHNARCPGGNLSCTPAGPPPQPVYFGLYCEKHAPLFYYESDGLQESICQGNSFEQLTTYALVNLTSQQQSWIQEQPCSIAQGAGASGCCGLSRNEDDVRACDLRSDVYCSNATNLCTKLECRCPPDIGGENCGAYCRASQMNNCVKVVNAKKQLEQNCVASACGALVPRMSDGVIVVSPCSRGACVASPDGMSADHPAPSFAPVNGKCTCNFDAPSTNVNNSDCFLYGDMISQRASKARQNQSLYAETCCGKGSHVYGGGGLPNASYCGQDCECNSIAIANQYGQCKNPFSSICTCNKDHCGHDCMGKCSESCTRHGTCLTTGYNQCGCDCNGGFVQKTDFGVTKAPLYVGLQCTVDCFDPKSAFLQEPLPLFDSTLEEQDAYLTKYLGNLTRCSGHGICALDELTGLPGCVCNSEYSGKNCNNSCYNSSSPYNDNAATADLAFNENGYRDCPLGHCLVDNPNSAKPDYECVRDLNVGRTQASPKNVNTTCFAACKESSTNSSSYVYKKCLCFLAEGLNLPCGSVQCPDNPEQSIQKYPGPRMSTSSTKIQEYMLGILQRPNNCRVCRDTGTIPTADCAPGFLSSGNAYKFVRGQNAAFGRCRQDKCPFGDVSKDVTVAVRFAINRDCSIDYFNGALQCSPMSLTIDDYYVAEHLEAGPQCVCDTANFYVDNVEADSATKCTKCSLVAAGSNQREQTTRCTCQGGSYFLPPGNCSETAPSDNSWCCLNMVPSCQCTKAPSAASRWLSASVQNNARYASHTFCNSALDVACNANGFAIDSAVFPSNYTYSNILKHTNSSNRSLVGQFTCKPLLASDGLSAYHAKAAQQTWLFGFNCVRMLRPVLGISSSRYRLENVTNDPQTTTTCNIVPTDEEKLCPFVLYSARLSNSSWTFGLYNQWTLLFNAAAVGYSTLTQNMCQITQGAGSSYAYFYCQPRFRKQPFGSFSYRYFVNARAAAFIPGAAFGITQGQMPRINFTVPGTPVVPRANAQCYNLNMYLPMQGSGESVSPLCAYLLLYGGLTTSSYQKQNMSQFCIDLFLNAENLVQLQNVPGILTGDSCRDMLLTDEAANKIAQYEGSRLLNILDLHGTADDNLVGRIHGVFGATDPITSTLPANPFIIDRVVADAYWCNPATLRCEFGRNLTVEASLKPTRFKANDTVENMLNAGVTVDTAFTSMGCYNVSCDNDDCTNLMSGFQQGKETTLYDIHSNLNNKNQSQLQNFCKIEEEVPVKITQQYPIQWRYSDIVNKTAFEAYELVGKGANVGALDNSVVQLHSLPWAIDNITFSQMCASSQPSPYLCAFFTPILPQISQHNAVYRFAFDADSVELLTCGGVSSSVPCTCPQSLDAHARCQEVVLPQSVTHTISCDTPGLVPEETRNCNPKLTIPPVANAL